MFPIAAVELSDVIVIVATLTSAVGVLATAIAYMFWSKLNVMEKRIVEIDKNQGDEVKGLAAHLAAAATNLDIKIAAQDVRVTQRHDATTARVFERIENVEKLAIANDKEVRRDISDVSVTVAGFGAAYVPRREFEEYKKEG